MTSPTIKPDPEVQEEHDELLMSYLNADCLSGDSWPLTNDEQHPQHQQQPLSPPYSTSSDGSINNAEDAYTNKSEDMYAGAPAPNMMDYTSWLAAAAAAGLPPANNLTGAAAASSTYWPAPPPPEFLQSFVPPLYIQQAAAINQSPNIPLLQPSIQPQPQQQDVKLSSASSTASCSSSDSEQPRKKRGRKKKDPIGIASAPSTQLRPLARLLPASAQPPQQPNNNTSSSSTTATPSPPPQQLSTSPSPSPPSPPVVAVKEQQQQQQQPIIPTTQVAQQQQQLPLTSNDNTSSIPASVKIEPSHSSPEEAQKAAAIAKRQERLIKNRAAALLSRKRKREHLNALEEEKQNLSKENEQLKARVAELESKVDTLEKENHDLRRRMVGNNNTALLSSNKNTSHNKATGVVFMIILFSFALFSLPSRSVNQLTVGGSSPKQLVGGASSLDLTFFNGGAPTTPRPTLDSGPSSSSSITPSTDLVLIDPVRPYALRNWIQDRLTTTTTTTATGGHGNNVKNHEKSLVQWSSDAINKKAATPRPHIYLYSPEFSQVAPIMNDTSTTAACEDNGSSSTFLMNEDNHNNAALLSLISPLPADKNTSYLQIDVQVLGSRIIDGPLMSLEQCPFATSLLDNMKDDLLCTRPTLSTDDNPISSTTATTTTTAKDNTTTDGSQHALKLPTGRRLNKDMRRRLVGQERARKIARVAD